MATLANDAPVAGYRSNQSFFVKMAWTMSVIIVFAFAQNAALGRVDIPAVPVWVHLHALLMLAWLALFITQNRLAASGNIALHRKLGRAGAGLAAVIMALACFTAVKAVELHRSPPFFTPAFFLSLVFVGVLAFTVLFMVAIAKRRQTEMHRRLMTGTTILILEPAFGRLLPAPLLGGEMTEWVVMLIQLGFVSAIALHDRRTLGRVHAATLAVALTVVLYHVLMVLLGHSAPMIALAERLGGAG